MALPVPVRTILVITLAAPLLFGSGWVAARRMAPRVSSAQEPVPAPGQAAPDADRPPPVAAAPGSLGNPAGLNFALPASAASLLGKLDPSGNLKSQAEILNYASSLDLKTAATLARSFEGKGYSGDRNLNNLRQAVFSRWAELDATGLVKSAQATGDYYYRWGAMSAGFDTLSKKDGKAAWNLASGMGPLKQDAQRAVLYGLAVTNPQEAFDFAAGLKGAQNTWAMENLMGTWAERDPSAAAAAAAGLPRGQMRNNAMSGLMGRWATVDYEAAAGWAAALAEPQERANAMAAALTSLSRMDPEKSLRLLDSTELGTGRGEVISQAIGSLALRDFSGALSRFENFATFTDKAACLSALAEMATDENRNRLLELAATLPANLARSVYQSGIWRSAFSDPDGMLDTLDKIPLASLREQARTQAVQSLGYYEADKASELYGKLQASSQTPEMASRIASSLAWTNPAKAVAWAGQLGTEAAKKSALAAALGNWAGTDPEGAGQEIAKITNPDTRSEVTRSVAQSLAQRSLGEAERWADSLTGADRSSALGKVTEQAAAQAPDRVESLYGRFVSGLSPEQAERSENQAIARSVAGQLAQTEPDRAAAWAQSLPEGGARDEAVAGVVSTWAGYDAVAASQWLQELPAGKGRDLATGNLVNTIAKDDPESAWAWATSIEDSARRRDAASAALSGWKANGNRPAAQAALDAAGFSDEEHRELSRKLE